MFTLSLVPEPTKADRNGEHYGKNVQLEDPLEIAYGSDILSLIAGHDIDADRRQRNREFVSSGDYQHRKTWGLVSSIPRSLVSALVLP